MHKLYRTVHLLVLHGFPHLL